MKTTKNIFALLIIAIMAMVLTPASAQETEVGQRYLDFSNRVGRFFHAEVKDGKLTGYRLNGIYIGASGGATFKKVNSASVINPNAAAIIGVMGNHWHAEARIGATQFEYMGAKKIGLQTDLGLYYDFLPLVGSKANFYIGGFGGYQAVKFNFVKEACTDEAGNYYPKTTTPYSGNSFRFGGEVGATIRVHYTNHIGVYARCYTYSFKAGEQKVNACAVEAGLRFTFGINRKVKY